MKYSPKRIGLLQAAGLALYVGFFAVLAFSIRELTEEGGLSVHPIVGVSLFLLAFVISAIISGSIVLAYPLTLFFDGRRRDALKIVFWNAVWLIAIFFAVAVAGLFVGARTIFF